MAGDAARLGTVSVRLRRVVAGRAVRRLLVLGGLLIAGWLLGTAAPAHADEMPVKPSQVIRETPVLADAVGTVQQREPVRRVVRAVVEKRPHEGKVTPDAPPLPDTPEVHEVAGVPVVAEQVPEVNRRAHEDPVPQVRSVPVTDGHASRQVVRDHPVPFQAPERPDGHSAGGGSAASGVTAGLADVVAWALTPPRASDSHLFGAVPPVVRTAADEPSFAPD